MKPFEGVCDAFVVAVGTGDRIGCEDGVWCGERDPADVGCVSSPSEGAGDGIEKGASLFLFEIDPSNVGGVSETAKIASGTEVYPVVIG